MYFLCWLYIEVSMCYSQSMAFHTYIQLTPTDIYRSRKLDCPSTFHTGHFPFLQRSILGALAKVILPLSSVVTMTSGLHKSWLGHFYGSSGLHLNDQSFTAIVKSNVIICLKESIVWVYGNITMCLPVKSIPTLCVWVPRMPFFPLNGLTLNQYDDLSADIVHLLQIKMDISSGSNVVYQRYWRGYFKSTESLFQLWLSSGSESLL